MCGIENIPVIDVSVRLFIPGANINATTNLLAKGTSDMLLGKSKLPVNLWPFSISNSVDLKIKFIIIAVLRLVL